MKKTVDESQMTPEQIYLSRLADFERYYLSLLIFAAAAVGVGIVIAVITSVLLGVALVVLSASVYVYRMWSPVMMLPFSSTHRQRSASPS